MTFQEKVLYHQIHPLKLTADVGAAVISLYFFWRHDLVTGLITHFAPPIIASALLLGFGDFEHQKDSSLGRYVTWHMTRSIEAIRLAGDIVMVFGAWYRAPLVIAGGIAIVILAWAGGPLRRHSS